MVDRSPLFALLIALAAPALGLAAPPPAFEEILKIDVHSHFFDDVPEVVEMMDRAGSASSTSACAAPTRSGSAPGGAGRSGSRRSTAGTASRSRRPST